MPSPIGHSIAGIALFWVVIRRRFVDRKILIIAILATLLPDVDFIFGFFIGNPNRFHHQFTHSLVFVLLAGLALSLLTKVRTTKEYFAYTSLFSLLGFLHLFLDAACIDTSAPYGMKLLWPFSEKFYIFIVTPLLDVQRSSDSATFFSSMLNWHNLKTISLEILIFMPLSYLAYQWNRKVMKSHDKK